MGSFQNPFFRQRKINAGQLAPRKEQKVLMNSIIDLFHRQHRAVIFLHGATGTGKSIMGLLLAKELNGIYCSTLKPWQPGDSIGELYLEIEPTFQNPLILVYDEVDIAINRIHTTILSHQEVPIMVADKNGWNRMLDEISWGLYPNMILLMTSNSVPQSIQDLDPSYLRKGRVDICAVLS
jgi:DNA polymerase III delta prime subunit